MAKKKHSNTDELRTEFARQLSAATKGISKKVAAEKLGISRQMLYLYLKGAATPGGEVVKKACDAWNLTLSIKGLQFSGEAFGSDLKTVRAEQEPRQMSLLDLLDKLRNDQLEAKIVGRDGDTFILSLQIKLVA
jgi:transcriptional regulator with XRE-family HTH domain